MGVIVDFLIIVLAGVVVSLVMKALTGSKTHIEWESKKRDGGK